MNPAINHRKTATWAVEKYLRGLPTARAASITADEVVAGVKKLYKVKASKASVYGVRHRIKKHAGLNNVTIDITGNILPEQGPKPNVKLTLEPRSKSRLHDLEDALHAVELLKQCQLDVNRAYAAIRVADAILRAASDKINQELE
jgi:hypothetical protein